MAWGEDLGAAAARAERPVAEDGRASTRSSHSASQGAGEGVRSAHRNREGQSERARHARAGGEAGLLYLRVCRLACDEWLVACGYKRSVREKCGLQHGGCRQRNTQWLHTGGTRWLHSTCLLRMS